MAWIAVDKGGHEIISDSYPIFDIMTSIDKWIYLPKGTIKKLIGRDLTWQDEPVELKEE